MIWSGQAICQERPSWAKNLPNIIEMQGYVQGLGSAMSSENPSENETWETAINRARSNLINQIQVQIISESTSQIQETDRNGQFDVESFFSEDIRAFSSLELQDVQVERWYEEENGLFYAYVKVPENYIQSLQKEYLENAQYASEFYREVSNRFIENGDVFSGLLMILDGAESLHRLRMNIQKTGRSGQTSYDIDKIIAEYEEQGCNLLGKIKLYATTTIDRKIDPNQSYPGLINGNVIFETGQEKENITGQINMSVAGRKPFDADMSIQYSGNEFQVNLEEIYAASGRNELEIKIELPQYNFLMDPTTALSRCIQNLSLLITVEVEGRGDHKIGIQVIERTDGTPATHQQASSFLMSALTGNGFEVSTGIEGNCRPQPKQEYDYFICGQVDVRDKSNPRPNIYFATAEASIKVYDVEQKKAVHVINLESVREGGNSYRSAGNRAASIIYEQITSQVLAFFDERYSNVLH